MHQSSRGYLAHKARPGACSTSRRRQHLPNSGTPAATDRSYRSCTSHLSYTAHSSHAHLVQPSITMICRMTCARREDSGRRRCRVLCTSGGKCSIVMSHPVGRSAMCGDVCICAVFGNYGMGSRRVAELCPEIGPRDDTLEIKRGRRLGNREAQEPGHKHY